MNQESDSPLVLELVTRANGDGVRPRVDHEKSAKMARRIAARFRRCWQNAARAIPFLGDGASYVEGWIVVHSPEPYVVEHGWCEVGDHIVDPTYTPTVTMLEPPLAYFGGLRLDPEETSAVLRSRRLPLAWGYDREEYRSAFEAALRTALRSGPRPKGLKTRLVDCRFESCDVYIGRPSAWANPFRIGRDGTREQIVAKYRGWLVRQPSLLRHLPRLRGTTLGCDCGAAPCHGDVLVELADFDH